MLPPASNGAIGNGAMAKTTTENQATIAHTRADEGDRWVGFLVETVIWGVVFFSLKGLFDTPLPFYVETIGTWPLFIAYKSFMLYKNGAHLGHMVAGIQIVDYRTGGKLSVGQAIARTIPEFSYELIIFLVVNAYMVMVRDDHRHAFDLIAGTIAVKAKDEEIEAEYTDEENSRDGGSGPQQKETDDGTLYRESDRPPFT